MLYWIIFIILFISFGFIIFDILRKKIKKESIEKITLGISISLACILLSLIILFCMDIPSALSGGEEIYVNELPTTVNYLTIRKHYTDNKELRHLKGRDWNKYEKYGYYRIRYTKLTRFVLSVEKLD